MIAFTNDDLKRLKELYTNAQSSGWSFNEEMEFNSFFEEHLLALLARLEAAEDVLGGLVYGDQYDDMKRRLDKWRRVAGK